MITLILDDIEVQKAQKRFQKNMQRYASGEREIQISYQGGSEWHTVSYSEEMNFWWAHVRVKAQDYYWTPVGLTIPEEQSKQPIVLEMNFQFSGNKKTDRASLFAKNESGEIFLVHSQVSAAR